MVLECEGNGVDWDALDKRCVDLYEVARNGLPQPPIGCSDYPALVAIFEQMRSDLYLI